MDVGKTSREEALKLVREDGLELKGMDDALRADKQVVLEAVCSSGGLALKYAAAPLRADKDIVMQAVNLDGRALASAHEDMRADKEVVLAAVSSDWRALPYADSALRADMDVVLAALRLDFRALQYADSALRSDKDVVLAAVRQSGEALEFADEAFLSDQDVLSAGLDGREHLVVLRITALSGKSCCCVLNLTELLFDGTGIVDFLSTQCSYALSLGGPVHADFLLTETGAALPDTDAFCNLERGKVHEVQLLVRSA